MSQIVFAVIVLIVMVSVSPAVRSVVFHAKVWRFIRMFLLTLVIIAVLALIGAGIWYWWTVLRLEGPDTSWRDETLQLDEHPETPGAGGPKKPTIVE